MTHFLGKKKEKKCGILYLESIKGVGLIAWYKKCAEKYYFDSYGIPPPNEVVAYVQNKYSRQVFCGHLCLYVLIRMSKGRDLQEIINEMYR